jgi:hypothetical protein
MLADDFRAEAMVLPVQAEVHDFAGDGKEEFILALGGRIRIGGRLMMLSGKSRCLANW